MKQKFHNFQGLVKPWPLAVVGVKFFYRLDALPITQLR